MLLGNNSVSSSVSNLSLQTANLNNENTIVIVPQGTNVNPNGNNNGHLPQNEVNNILNSLNLANRAEVVSNVLYTRDERGSMGWQTKVSGIKNQLNKKDNSGTPYFLQTTKKIARNSLLNKSKVLNRTLKPYNPDGIPKGTYNTNNKKIKGSNGKLSMSDKEDYEKIQKWARNKGFNALPEYINKAVENSQKKTNQLN